jgi:hypothetical protein
MSHVCHIFEEGAMIRKREDGRGIELRRLNDRRVEIVWFGGQDRVWDRGGRANERTNERRSDSKQRTMTKH